SKGQDPASAKITIPGVIGMTVSEATAALQNAGFDVYVAGDDSASAIVSKQNPTGTAKKGTTITLTAAAAPAPTPPTPPAGGGSTTPSQTA
ncbi:MAG: PASTA domain-containing protein, partial [Raoultibacter sp.]